jgi:transposase-like protein
MECERCGVDATVHRYDVDGFTGYLCDDCRKEWARLTNSE